MLGSKYVIVLNIHKFLWISHGSEYASGCNYGRVLNIPGFQVCQISAYATVAQGPEYASIRLNNALWLGSKYAWSKFNRVLNKPPVLNMPGVRIWQSCEYVRVTQGAFWICLNKPDYAFINCRCTIYWAVIKTEKYSELCQTCKMVHFAKKIMPECRCANRNFSGQGVVELGT